MGLMTAIHSAGSQYGLALNWGQLEALPVRCESAVHIPDGGTVPCKDSMVYLGGSCALPAGVALN